MANPEHLAILLGGVEAWNQWRSDNDTIQPDLSGAVLVNEDLRKARLSFVELSGADLVKANLSGVNLVGANLSGANLVKANLVKAELNGASLSGANLFQADLNGAGLQADLSAAILNEADLSGADLFHAELSGAYLRWAKLRGANLNEADLSGADLRHAKGLSTDNTYIKDARFEPRAKDWWSRLRRTYTGPKLLLNVLLLVAFFVPYIAQTVIWLGINNSQEALISTTAELNQVAEDLRVEESPAAQALGDVVARLGQLQPCLASDCQETPIWKVLIGLDGRAPIQVSQSYAIPAWWLTVILLFYNLCRVVLTLIVGPLREEEERSGYTPSARYKALLIPHYAMSVLLVIAVGSFLLHTYDWLTRSVWLPVG